MSSFWRLDSYILENRLLPIPKDTSMHFLKNPLQRYTLLSTMELWSRSEQAGRVFTSPSSLVPSVHRRACHLLLTYLQDIWLLRTRKKSGEKEQRGGWSFQGTLSIDPQPAWVWTAQVHLRADCFSINTVNILPLPYGFLNNIFFSLIYCKNTVCNLYDIHRMC